MPAPASAHEATSECPECLGTGRYKGGRYHGAERDETCWPCGGTGEKPTPDEQVACSVAPPAAAPPPLYRILYGNCLCDELLLVDELVPSLMSAACRMHELRLGGKIDQDKAHISITGDLSVCTVHVETFTPVVPTAPRQLKPLTFHIAVDDYAPRLLDLLLLAGVDVDAATIAQWSRDVVVAAMDWAEATHLRASDNDDVDVPHEPEVLRSYGIASSAPGGPARAPQLNAGLAHEAIQTPRESPFTEGLAIHVDAAKPPLHSIGLAHVLLRDAFKAGAEYMRRSTRLAIVPEVSAMEHEPRPRWLHGYYATCTPDAERVESAAAGYIEGLPR